MAHKDVPYLAYLLRLWPVEAGGRVRWRASLQCVESGERIGFEDLEALLAYLQAETAMWEEQPGSGGGSEH